MSWLDQVIGYGTHAARPAAGSAGRLYYETDTATLFRDNGTTWDGLTLGSGSPTLVELHDIYLDTAPASTFDFTDIDQSYKALRVEGLLRSTDPAVTVLTALTINTDALTHYDWNLAFFFDSTVGDNASLGQTSINLGTTSAGGAPAGDFSAVEIWLPGYSNTHMNKAVRSYVGNQGEYTAAHLGHEYVDGYWNSTAGITRLTITPATGQWAQYSRLTLYGLM